MKKILLTGFILCFLACKKEKFAIVNLNGNKITSIGHGGMGPSSAYPIDTFESLSQGLMSGGDGVEFDVQLSKDSVVVLYHDKDLSEETNLSGSINSLNWSEIKEARYHPRTYLSYSIISLEEFLSKIDNPRDHMYTLDCKVYNIHIDIKQFYECFVGAIDRIVQKYGLEENVCIESIEPDYLKIFKKRKPAYKLFIYPHAFETGLEQATTNDLYGISIAASDVTKSQIKTAHDAGKRVAIWNIHDAHDNKEAIEKSPDYIQTDRLKNLVKLLNKY